MLVEATIGAATAGIARLLYGIVKKEPEVKIKEGTLEWGVVTGLAIIFAGLAQSIGGESGIANRGKLQ
jgi:hypothetical protein